MYFWGDILLLMLRVVDILMAVFGCYFSVQKDIEGGRKSQMKTGIF